MPHRSTFFASDFHLFSRRSLAERYRPSVHAAASQAQTFILGGDIFDFRWSTFDSPEETVRQAIRWLDGLVGSHTRCDFHYVQGNHDCNGRFVAALTRYSATRRNLWVHPYWLRLGRNVFLHGDAADHPQMCQQRLARRREHWARDEWRGPVRHMLYDLAVSARLHRLAGKVAHPRRRVAARLLGYLEREQLGPDRGIEHIYFGHTHDALANFVHRGVTFHNPGAPIAGLAFRIVEVAS